MIQQTLVKASHSNIELSQSLGAVVCGQRQLQNYVFKLIFAE